MFVCGENCTIGENNRFSGKINIGKNVLIGPDNFIASDNHQYQNPFIPIKDQGITNGHDNNNCVHIGDDSWIGTHCAILGNVSIGKHCVIGANCVVTKSIPDYSIVVGNPMRIIKFYNFKTKQWEK